MTAQDAQIEAREGVDQETVDTVQSISGTYKYGWETEIEMEFAHRKVVTRGHRAADFGKAITSQSG